MHSRGRPSPYISAHPPSAPSTTRHAAGLKGPREQCEEKSVMAQSATEFVERTDAGQAPPGPARISGEHLVAKALSIRVIDVRQEQVA